MRLPEVRAALEEVEGIFNLLTLLSLGIHNDTQSGASGLDAEVQRMLLALADSPTVRK